MGKAIENDMILISKGIFTVGPIILPSNDYSPPRAAVNTSSEVMTLVTKNVELTRDFYMGKHPVTQELWDSIKEKNLSQFKGPKLPVERVNWFDCIVFCNELSKKEGLEPVYTIPTKIFELMKLRAKFVALYALSKSITQNLDANGYRLPTEVEWECAAQGLPSNSKEMRSSYSGGNNPEEVSWNISNSENKTQPVGQKEPNAFGLYDMSGNVWEWCWDRYDITLPEDIIPKHVITEDVEVNPIGTSNSYERIRRGGSYQLLASSSIIVNRYFIDPDYRDNDMGFRLVRTKTE